MIKLSDDIIQLRAVEPSDIDLLVRWENDPSFWDVSDRVTPLSRDILERYIEQSHLDLFQAGQFRYIITRKGDPVGTIDLFDLHAVHRRVGIGILIAETDDRRQGIAQRALSLVTDYCFHGLNLHSIYCHIRSSNEASIRLFEKVGFERMGELKDWIHTSEGFGNVLIYQRLRKHA
ncbi:MAG: GNAT family N-acetyltransferase [Bacteroidota bacterium]|nr:GNAT family N-acetyltransferase [Bacteroidota bacterium]MDX5428456.1 GNAT family N-acetyltransferase [Bacteroidota bacterium]MDX5506221.1 GNAT family N-acetyltransferase [Bacteroidota bacterium]